MGLHQLGRFEQTARLALTFGGFLVMWEIVVRVVGIPAYILPPPSQILFDLWRKLPRLATAAGYTVQPMLLGFLTAVVVGVLLALVIAFSRRLEGVVYPLLVFFQIIPKIAIAPLFIIWFGFGLHAESAARVPALVLSGGRERDHRVPFRRRRHRRSRTVERRVEAADVLEGAVAARAADAVHRIQGRGRARRPPRRSSRSSWPPTRGSGSCCSSTTARSTPA